MRYLNVHDNVNHVEHFHELMSFSFFLNRQILCYGRRIPISELEARIDVSYLGRTF